MAVAVRILLKIILMIILSLKEVLKSFYLQCKLLLVLALLIVDYLSDGS